MHTVRDATKFRMVGRAWRGVRVLTTSVSEVECEHDGVMRAPKP